MPNRRKSMAKRPAFTQVMHHKVAPDNTPSVGLPKHKLKLLKHLKIIQGEEEKDERNAKKRVKDVIAMAVKPEDKKLEMAGKRGAAGQTKETEKLMQDISQAQNMNETKASKKQKVKKAHAKTAAKPKGIVKKPNAVKNSHSLKLIWPKYRAPNSQVKCSYDIDGERISTPDRREFHELPRLQELLKSKVEQAFKKRQIFTTGRRYPTVRRALLQRGWLEKPTRKQYEKLRHLSQNNLLRYAEPGNEYEALAMANLMRSVPTFFLWYPQASWRYDASVQPYISRVALKQEHNFTTKYGLTQSADQTVWHEYDGYVRYPRSYRLNCSDKRDAFINDYRLTQVRCLMRHICAYEGALADAEKGTVPYDTIEFTLHILAQQLSGAQKIAADKVLEQKTDFEWQRFLQNSKRILRRGEKFKTVPEVLRNTAVTGAELLKFIDHLHPDYQWDGVQNLWIMKPGSGNRGNGIVINDDLALLLNCAKNTGYVAQKYIERPLLIYDTKFDLRVYVLLTINKTAATIWLYKDCYLKFCSKNFDLSDRSKSVHISNHAIQRHCKVAKTRDARLPPSNMWSLFDFLQFLRENQESSDIWLNHIFPAIKQTVIGFICAGLHRNSFVPNRFEIYGCDFMLDEQYNPILLEVNGSPDFSHTTEVTKRICVNVQHDLLKVVLDLPQHGPKASTGLFEKVCEIVYGTEKSWEARRPLKIRKLKLKTYTFFNDEEYFQRSVDCLKGSTG